MKNLNHIAENIKEINERITNAAAKSGRKRDDILLLGVTKTVDIPSVVKAVECGVTDVGENKVQEFLRKYEDAESKLNVNWHIIGHLQTNKVKYVVSKVKLIHSVDSLGLAKEINKRAEAAGIVQDILVEVNMGGEDTKFGLAESKTKEFIKSLSELNAIAVKGLMTVAPYVANPEENRNIFKKMRTLSIDINGNLLHNDTASILSMGMSNDYEAAIEEGANIVRIGTGIFGDRI